MKSVRNPRSRSQRCHGVENVEDADPQSRHHLRFGDNLIAGLGDPAPPPHQLGQEFRYIQPVSTAFFTRFLKRSVLGLAKRPCHLIKQRLGQIRTDCTIAGLDERFDRRSRHQLDVTETLYFMRFNRNPRRWAGHGNADRARRGLTRRRTPVIVPSGERSTARSGACGAIGRSPLVQKG
jgi:hypothetical protein